jgi:hypothetical protein
MSNEVEEGEKQENKPEDKPRKLTAFICGKNRLLSLEDLSESDQKMIQKIIDNWGK